MISLLCGFAVFVAGLLDGWRAGFATGSLEHH